jgi:ribose transport system ATP-binding protein
MLQKEATMDSNVILATSGLIKVFSSVRVLDEVDFELNKGEVHAILGENGAGKSTLIKILGGIYKPDGGQILLDGKSIFISSPRAAQLLGIRVIHQEFNLLPQLSVAENVFLGNLPGGKAPGSVDWKMLRLRAKKILDRFQTKIDPDSKACTLTPGGQQLVEIAQALTSDVNILILDEPSAALNETETENLFGLLKQMCSEGISIVYITHKINEVFEIADRVTVLRDGKKVDTVNTSDTNQSQLIQMMVGRSLKDMYPRNRVEPGKILLETRDLTGNGLFDINLKLRAGEVLGIYGLMGSGRTRLANALFGVVPASSGDILINDKKVKITSPEHAKQFGLGYVPAERKTEALIGPLTLLKNLTIASLSKYTRSIFFIDESGEKNSCIGWMKALEIRAQSPDVNIGSLSGGNQQKTIFCRWLDTKSEILLLNEPTRGVDVGAKVEIYKLIDDFCKNGKAVIMFSSEMTELLAIADRIMVMNSGRNTGEFSYQEATQRKLIECALPKNNIAQQPCP